MLDMGSSAFIVGSFLNGNKAILSNVTHVCLVFLVDLINIKMNSCVISKKKKRLYSLYS